MALEELPEAVRELIAAGGAPMVQVKPRSVENELIAVYARFSKTGFVGNTGMSPVS